MGHVDLISHGNTMLLTIIFMMSVSRTFTGGDKIVRLKNGIFSPVSYGLWTGSVVIKDDLIRYTVHLNIWQYFHPQNLGIIYGSILSSDLSEPWTILSSILLFCRFN